MAKERSESSKYQSRYGGGWVSPAQYLTECLCILIAKQEKKELGDNFWQKSPWNKIFRTQITMVNRLLKEYSAEIILATMRDKRCWKMRSFGARWLLNPLLEEKQREHDAIAAQQSNTVREKTSTTEKPRKAAKKKKSLLANLRDIENDDD